MRLGILFHRLGPYHVARIAAAARRGSVFVIEFSRVDRVYQWDLVKDLPCERVTLFEERDVVEYPAKAVWEAMRCQLDRLRPDALAIPGWSGAPALAALDWCVRTGTPAIVMSESTSSDAQRYWLKERVKSAVVCLYSAALVGGKPQERYAERLGIPKSRIRHGYDAVDNEYFQRAALQCRIDAPRIRETRGLPRDYFLTSSRFVPKKNIIRLIEAYARYRQAQGAAPWHLVILGDGPLKSAIDEARRKLCVEDFVLMPGFAQYHELPDFYALARCFVLASTSEQWGLVVNEAMASGLPVLVSRHCGCAEDLVEQGRNGYTFDPYDVPEMARLMSQIHRMAPELEGMGRASVETISRFGTEAFAQGLWQCAREACDHAPRPRVGAGRRAMLRLLAR